MNIDQLTAFFMWCTIINGGLLVFWSPWLLVCPGLVYRVHTLCFAMSRETFNVVVYCFVGAFKILWIVFNLVPWLALEIVTSG